MNIEVLETACFMLHVMLALGCSTAHIMMWWWEGSSYLVQLQRLAALMLLL
jgi:hypothetical protein